jgi:hypothetical protein
MGGAAVCALKLAAFKKFLFTARDWLLTSDQEK